MGSEGNLSKPHYDITMSKRTRKALNLGKEADQSYWKVTCPEKESPPKGVNEEEKSSTEGEESDRKISLKELIKGRSSLGQHFTEEKQLLLVVKPREEDLDGVKFKKLVSRYARVLSRLIKIKRDRHLGSQKKPALQLAM